MYLSIAHENASKREENEKSIEYRLKKFEYRARAVVSHAESVYYTAGKHTWYGLFKVFWFLFVKMCLQSTRL